MICVKCGKHVTKNIKGLCPECYTKSQKIFFLPKKLNLEKCSHCGSYKTGNGWQQGSDIPQMVLNGKITWDVNITDPHFKIDTKYNSWMIHCQGKVHNKDVIESYNLPVKIHTTACPRCSMIKGGYYEALIQVRGTKRNLTSDEKTMIHQIISKKIANAKDPRAFITKIDELPHGVDYYLGEQHISESLTRQLKQHFHATTKKSVSLMGVKDGQKIYRVTHLIRLPAVNSKDIIQFHDVLYQVVDLKNRVVLRNLQSGETQSISYKELLPAIIIHPKIKNAIILSETPKELQIMDPDTYKTRDIKKPQDYKRWGEETPIIKWDNKIYLLTRD